MAIFWQAIKIRSDSPWCKSQRECGKTHTAPPVPRGPICVDRVLMFISTMSAKVGCSIPNSVAALAPETLNVSRFYPCLWCFFSSFSRFHRPRSSSNLSIGLIGLPSHQAWDTATSSWWCPSWNVMALRMFSAPGASSPAASKWARFFPSK